jgi:hypothetical protein
MHGFQQWRDLIQGAGDIAAVRRVVRDYVATIGAAVTSTLPSDCQRALQDDDIQAAAVTLMQHELRSQGEPMTSAVLHEIAQTYAAAATRITRLSREPLIPGAK